MSNYNITFPYPVSEETRLAAMAAFEKRELAMQEFKARQNKLAEAAKRLEERRKRMQEKKS